MEQSVESVSQIAQVRPVGEIDMQTWESFAAELDTALASGAPYIELCFDNVTFLDSSGIRVIVECANNAKDNGVEIHVSGASGEVQRVLEISGILGSIVYETPIDLTKFGDRDDHKV
jgi:anti-sigma B factor antagonist